MNSTALVINGIALGVCYENGKKKPPLSRSSLFSLLAVVLLVVILVTLFPGQREKVLNTSWRFFLEMITILPAIVVLIVFFPVFVSKEFISKYLSHASGIRGFVLSILLGALPTGPLYVAFSMAEAFRKKGVRTSNMPAFLTVWLMGLLTERVVDSRTAAH